MLQETTQQRQHKKIQTTLKWDVQSFSTKLLSDFSPSLITFLNFWQFLSFWQQCDKQSRKVCWSAVRVTTQENLNTCFSFAILGGGYPSCEHLGCQLSSWVEELLLVMGIIGLRWRFILTVIHCVKCCPQHSDELSNWALINNESTRSVVKHLEAESMSNTSTPMTCSSPWATSRTFFINFNWVSLCFQTHPYFPADQPVERLTVE